MNETQAKTAQAEKIEQPAGSAPGVQGVRPGREAIVVQSEVPVLDTGLFEQMQRIARLMAASSLVPEHLNRVRRAGGREVLIEPEEALANCFLVVDQAVRWRMDPFAVAQCVYVARGRIGYEGKLIAAVINSHPALATRLKYRFAGKPGTADRGVVVTARLKGDAEDLSIEGSVAQWQTLDQKGQVNESWARGADQMLCYRGAREWARRWLPEAILGVLADEEVRAIELAEPALEPEPRKGAVDALREAVGRPRPEAAPGAGEGTTPSPAAADAPIAQDQPARGGKPVEGGSDREAGKAVARSPGTPRLRKIYLEKLAEAKDKAVLDLVYDETSLCEWPARDRDELFAAYLKRVEELKPA